MMIKKPWAVVIKPYLKKYSVLTDRIFKMYNQEVKRRNLKSIAETNNLWNRKYKPLLNMIEKKMDREYKQIWNKYHSKK
jgi:hypothetical protein